MGLFVEGTGLAGVSAHDIETALSCYADQNGLAMKRIKKDPGEPWLYLQLVDGAPERASAVYPGGFEHAVEASAWLSTILGCPALYFHIHDEDLWMYQLFVDGKAVDRFNPIPAYWNDRISAAERKRWSGKPKVFAKHWPDVKVDEIAPYLKSWELNERKPGKAHRSDKHHYGDCFQLFDLLKRLGLEYPIDYDKKRGRGQVYQFGDRPPARGR
jgi:hypothetical protein